MAGAVPHRRALSGMTRFARHFWPYLKTERGLIAGSLVALLGGTVLRLLEPWPLKFVIDRVVKSGDQSGGRASIAALESLDPMTLLTVAAIAVVAIAALRAAVSYAATVGVAVIGNRVLTQVRNALFRHLQCLSLSFHTRARSGDLVIRMISDVTLLKDVAVTAALPLCSNVFVLAGMVAVMFWLNWQLALIAMLAAPLMWVNTIRRSRELRAVSRSNREREGAMAATASESIGAIKTVQSLSLSGVFSATFDRANAKSLREGVRATRLSAGLERTVDVLIAVSTALVLWFGARLVVKRELTPGELLVFLFYLKQAFRPLRDFAKYTGRLARAAAAADRIVDLLEQAPDVKDRPDAVTAPPLCGGIHFDRVQFGYEPGRSSVSGVDLMVPPGEHLAIVGPSGSGKSTLVSLVLRLYDPQQGAVWIDGWDVRDLTLESLRSQIAVVLQDTVLFAASVRENIAYGASAVSDDAIVSAAKLANAHEFIMALPQGYETVLGERGVTLSNGQRQRIAIARAAVRRSPILILDEPTTGLDGENERLVSEALERLARGRTTLHVTHRMHVAARADRIAFIDGGCIVEIGSHRELMARGGRYARLYRAPRVVTAEHKAETVHAVAG